MANLTITGCVNWSTGQVEFDMDSECASGNGPTLYGCIEWTGAYAGKVKVVITGRSASCNGTYYGCVDWTTGKFEVEVPEECCDGYACSHCSGTPQFVQCVLSGVTACACTGYQCGQKVSGTVDGTYVLEQVGSGSDACKWELANAFNLSWTNYLGDTTNCSGHLWPCGYDNADFDILLTRSSSQLSLQITCASSNVCSGSFEAFIGTTSTVTDCAEGTISNTTICGGNFCGEIASGGSATTTEL